MLKDQLPNLINEARKAKNEVRLLTLQSIKDNLSNAEIADRASYNEAIENKVLLKMVASHKDSIEQFASRPDLIAKEQAELDIIQEFAPKEVSVEEIKTFAGEIISNLKATNGSVSMKDTRTVLAAVQAKYPTAQGKDISNLIKSYM